MSASTTSPAPGQSAAPTPPSAAGSPAVSTAPRRSSTPPPEEFNALYDHVVTCGKCGFCQPTCPIFRATGRESSVARGKIALFRNMVEERTEIGPDTTDAFANCLLCRACTESCFSSVKTDKVVVSFRHAYADRFGRGLLQRGVFRTLLPRPRLMRGLVRTIWALRRTGLPDLARRAGLIGLLNPKLERAMELKEGTPGPLLHTRLKKRPQIEATDVVARTADGRSSAAIRLDAPRVGYWMSCGYNYVLPEVGEATIRVLERLGNQVEVLDNCCCGLAAYGYGDLEAAAALAQENIRRLGDCERFDAIVSECGSCSGHLKEYAELLSDDPVWAERAAALARKIRSFSEFVEDRGGLAAAQPSAGAVATEATPAQPGTEPEVGKAAAVAGPMVVTYHDPCHLGRRYQNVTAQPRSILRSLEACEFREAAESDSCCGAAGTYGILHPETSAAIIDRKVAFINGTGATVVATECPSCMMQLAYGLKRSGAGTQVLNISQLCDQELRARFSK